MKTALVTGTSSGIGFATALHLAQNGYRVFAGMRNLTKASAVFGSRASIQPRKTLPAGVRLAIGIPRRT